MERDEFSMESEYIFKSIFDTIIDGIVIIDIPTRKFQLYNDAFCRMLDYTKNEITNLGVRDIHSEATLAWVDKLFNSLENKGIESVREIPIIRKDGTIFYADITASTLEYKNIPHVVCTFRDITEHRLTEIKLRENEQRLSIVHKLVQLGSWSWNIKTGDVIWSEEIYKIFHLDPATFTPHIDSILALSPWPEEHERDQELIRKAIESHEKGMYEQRFLLPDKSIGYYQSTFQGNYDEAGNLVSIFGTILDISDRKRAEETLKKSEAALKSIFNATPIGLGLLIDDVYTKVNNSLCRIIGYSEQELLGHNLRLFYDDPHEFECIRNELYGQMAKNGLGIMETRLRRKDEVNIDAIICLSPLDSTDVSAGTTFSILDISVQKRIESEKNRLEEMLLHSQKLESIGRLAGGIAHDFNNLLTAIMGNAELAMEELDPAGELYSLMTTIFNAGESAKNLTQQLLAFSRKQIIKPKVFNINHAINYVEKMIHTLIGENIELSIVQSDDLYPIKADPGQIEQIIINLAANARDAMPDGGQLIIETSNVVLDEYYAKTHVDISTGDYVMIAITDTGMGMNKETMKNIFEPFFTTKELGHGTGLGLATVYGIVKQSGGTIEVYSEPSSGTTFKLYFPVSQEEELHSEEIPKKTVLPTGTETILLAEDNQQVLEFSRNILTRSGYTVLTASSGEEAVRMAKRYHGTIHLFITDVILPGINGRQAAEKITSIRSGIKTLYNSGYTAEVIDKKGILEHGFEFISKPFTSRELTQKVRLILDEKPSVSSRKDSRSKGTLHKG